MAEKADVDLAIERLKESKPPATDSFTYLTIIEKYLRPEILPALLEILEDANITRDIGWDLVDMLIKVPGSEDCLEAVARLGNPREVIIKTLEVMELLDAVDTVDEEDGEAEGAEDDGEGPSATPLDASQKFVTLVGMLGILHKRLAVKAPSRFLHQTLQTMYRAYQPTPEATAAVISFVLTVAGQSRPPLPTRKSSTTLSNPFQFTDSAKNAPDPEAEKPDEADQAETNLMKRLLQAFITCIVEALVNSHEMEWAARLLELYRPSRVVPNRRSLTQMFKEDENLLTIDALIGQLAALAKDLDITNLGSEKILELLKEPPQSNPMAVEPNPDEPDAIKLSTGGLCCLVGYWIFSSEAFGGNHDTPEMSIFPEHMAMFQHFLGEEPQAKVMRNPGSVEALLVMGLWLEKHNRVAGPGSSGETPPANYMGYHHLLTLCAIFHPSLNVRNAATSLAGAILHADPDPDDRLKILDDLLENCVFSSVQACAVTWLREELMSAAAKTSKGSTGTGTSTSNGNNDNNSCFATTEAVETLQYTLFPNVSYLKDVDAVALWDYWLQNHAFHLQVANFAYLLFSSPQLRHAVPEGVPAAVEQRYVEPLVAAAKTLQEAYGGGGRGGGGGGKVGPEAGVDAGAEVDMNAVMLLGVLTDRLQSLSI